MKRFLAFVLIIGSVLLLASCGYTAKKPLATENVDIPDSLATVIGGNDYLPEQRSWDDWAERVPRTAPSF